MLGQLPKVIDFFRRQNTQALKLVIKFQRIARRDRIAIRQIADQRGVRRVHQKRSDQNRTEQLAAIDQWKRDQIQIGLTGKHIGFPEHLRPHTGVDRLPPADLGPERGFLKHPAILCRRSQRNQVISVRINHPDRDVHQRVQRGQHVLQFLF